MKNKRKGFSLVELLAVIVILGIISTITIVSYSRYIKTAKDEVDNQNKNTAIMATKSYLNSNSQYRPKYAGDFSEVSIEDLIDKQYIKRKDFVDYNKKPYKSDSYVSVTKVSSGKYKYKAYLFKEGEDKYSIYGENPYIDLSIDVKPESGRNYIDISSASFTANLYADRYVSEGIHSDSYISSYSYVIYIAGLEVYNSGFLYSGRQKLILKNIDLSKYTNITKSNDIKIYIIVKNNKGKIATQSRTVNAEDNKAPICGNISYNSDSWYGKNAFDNGKKKIVTVQCIDNGGSKCQKKQYTKVWDKHTIGEEKLYYDKTRIEIEDNKGNKNYCEVNAHIDTINPKVSINADNNAGMKAFEEAKAFEDTTGYIYKDSYLDAYGSDKWLNKDKYPNGIYYDIDAYDTSGIKSVKWGANEKLINNKEDENLNDLIYNSSYNPMDDNKLFFENNTNFSKRIHIDQDGIRYVKLSVYDVLGNETIVHIYANIDHTDPTDPIVKGYKNTSSNDLTSEKDLSSYKFGEWYNGHAFVKASGSTDAVSGVEGYYCTTSGQKTNLDNVKQNYRNVHVNGTATVGFKAKDNAGNYSNFINKTVNLDRTAPIVTCSYNDNRISIDPYDNESSIKNTYKLTSTASSSNSIRASWGDISTPNCGTTYYAYVKATNNAGITSSIVKCSGSYSYSCGNSWDCNVRGKTKKYQSYSWYGSCGEEHRSGYAHYCCIVGSDYNNEKNCVSKCEREDIFGDLGRWICPNRPFGTGDGWTVVDDSNWNKGAGC